MQIADNWLNDIPQQFIGKKRIEALIEAFSRQLQELQSVFDGLDSLTDLDTATGSNLDMVGSILSLSRKEASVLAGMKTSETIMDDDTYRKYLKYKNIANTNDCTYADLMNGLNLLWDVDTAYYKEDGDHPATIFLSMPYLNPESIAALESIPMIKPAGVQIQHEYHMNTGIEGTAAVSGCVSFGQSYCIHY